jgi:S-methylmethionine-dependent homocysteine/selenocysteine methylase
VEAAAGSQKKSAAYAHLERRWLEGGVVLLDGGVGSELERVGYPSDRNIALLWGTRALYDAPDLTREVHRRYVQSGADVITTNTWRIDGIPEAQARGLIDDGMKGQHAARLGVELAREAIVELGRGDECAVAFSLFLEPVGLSLVPELADAAATVEPDLILVETCGTIPEDLEFPEYEILLETGLPLWVSYRWTVNGPPDLSSIGIPPARGGSDADGERLGRAAQRLEHLGVAAVLLNCLPRDLVAGALPMVRRFTTLPLGVYPNLGVWVNPGWGFDETATPEAFVADALRWRDHEGASIIGGCCGTTAEHIAALAGALH